MSHSTNVQVFVNGVFIKEVYAEYDSEEDTLEIPTDVEANPGDEVKMIIAPIEGVQEAVVLIFKI